MVLLEKPKWLPICWGCEGPCLRIVFRKYRQNTAYVNEEMNWVKLCSKCQEINEECWAEMWSDFYGGL